MPFFIAPVVVPDIVLHRSNARRRRSSSIHLQRLYESRIMRGLRLRLGHQQRLQRGNKTSSLVGAIDLDEVARAFLNVCRRQIGEIGRTDRFAFDVVDNRAGEEPRTQAALRARAYEIEPPDEGRRS